MAIIMLSNRNDWIYVDKNNFIGHNNFMLSIADLFDVGDIVRAVRLRKGIKGKQIKTVLKTDKDTLSRIERTSRYDPDVLERIAEGLGTSVAEILFVRDALKSPSLQPNIGFCKEHQEEFRLLELILHGTRTDRDYWISGIKANLDGMSLAATQKESLDKGQHGPFRPTGTPMPGDKVSFVDYPVPVPVRKTRKKSIIKR
jgi:transcriptional regulator with XRE-family HTH domain